MGKIPTTILNEDYTAEIIKNQMNEEMIKAAEPVIEQALKDIEKRMREKLGSMVIAYMDSYMSVERFGRDLRIIIKHDHEV